MPDKNTPNPSISGLIPTSAGAARPFQRAPNTDPVWSGDKGMDQSVTMGSLKADKPANAGNCCPPVPAFERGNR